MVVNSFNFLNEFEQLKLRLEVLKNHVDVFVITEADVTFTGYCKPLFFKEARDYGYDFSGYNIVHIPVTNMPYGGDPWVREQHQRLISLNAIKSLNPDLALMTDTDEIIRPELIEHCFRSHLTTFEFQMPMLMYYINRIDTRETWRKVMAFKPKQMPVEKFDRGNFNGAGIFRNSGWHLEYMGGRDRLLYKIGCTSHAVEIGGRNFWNEIYSGKHDYSYCAQYDTNQLPKEADFLKSNPTFCLMDGHEDWVSTKKPYAGQALR